MIPPCFKHRSVPTFVPEVLLYLGKRIVTKIKLYKSSIKNIQNLTSDLQRSGKEFKLFSSLSSCSNQIVLL